LRNKIRHVLIPFLETHFSKKIKENVKKTALLIAEDEELIEELALSKFKEVRFNLGDDLALKVHELRALPNSLRKRIYFLAFKEAGVPLFRITHRHIDQIESLMLGKGKGPLSLPGKYLVYRGPGHLLFTKKVFKTSYYEITIETEGKHTLPDGTSLIVKKAKKVSDYDLEAKKEILLSEKKFSLPFVVRKRKEGDRVFVKNLGHKKLKKLLQEKKIPFYLRDQLPIIEYKCEIVAVFEVYVNPKFLPDSKEEKVWSIKLEKL